MAILGIDEVGRGPWAGPMVIGAVVLENPEDPLWEKLDDSKKLTARKRTELNEVIKAHATAYDLGWVSAKEIDRNGLSESLKIATRRAIKDIPKEKYTEIIIDGTMNFLAGTPQENLVSVLPKADGKIKAVSAASIIAKVARDKYMKDLAMDYPGYGFERNVGYGTREHQESLWLLGLCPEHRLNVRPVRQVALYLERQAAAKVFDEELAKILDDDDVDDIEETPTEIGKKAEGIVAEYLEESGHKILSRNYKTKFYEIDIISATSEHIYFTEVKYRKNSSHGAPLDFIDGKKRRQIEFAANAFMKYLSRRLGRPESDLPSPILAAAAVSGENYRLEKWLPLED